MFIWIGIATAWVACLAAGGSCADHGRSTRIWRERAERIAEREARLKSRKRGAPVLKAHE